MIEKLVEPVVHDVEQVDSRGSEEIRILLVVRWPVGGIRTFIRYVFSQWAGVNLKLTFVLPDLDEANALKEDLQGFNIEWRLVDKNASAIAMMKAVSLALKEREYDVIHAHGFTSAVCASLPAALRRKVFAIATSHDVLLSAQLAGTKGRLKRFLLARALNRFDVIHSVSNDAQRNLQAMVPGVDREKCMVIANGIETVRFLEAEPRNLREELNVAEDTVLLGFFGRFMAQKGFRYLIDAVESLNREEEKTFKVVCFGWGGFIREEQQTLRERGLDDYFIFMPFVSNVAGSMKGVDAVVMPSLWEACGLLAMEALTAGVPLVAARCIGLREVCENTPAIMVEPADAKALHEGIIEVTNTPRKRFTEFSGIAAARYDVSETAEGIRKLYLRAVR